MSDNILILTAFMGLLMAPCTLMADAVNVNGFYEENAARSTYQADVRLRDQAEVKIIPADKAPAELANAEQNLNELDKPSAALPLDNKPQQDVLKEFGDPSLDPPVNVNKDAPAPFKAMMAALETKNDELAFQYAKQYARYMRNLQARTDKVMGLTGAAMEGEGMLAKNGWQSSPEYNAYRKLLEKDKANSDKNNGYTGTVDTEARALLDDARGKFKSGSVDPLEANEPAPPAQVDEAAERAAIRKALAGRIPTDPFGEVDVYFFFRANDSEAESMFKDLEKFYSKSKTQHGMNFMALSLDVLYPDRVAKLKQRHGVTFPIQLGISLSEKLQVKKSPTTVFVCHTNGKAVFEEGSRPFYFLDEVVSIMRGGR